MTTPSDRPDDAATSPKCGRPKSGLPSDAQPAVIALKQWLRTEVGDTPLKTVADLSHYSISTVSTVIGGPALPPLRQVLRVAGGVGASQRRAHELWYAAALEAFTAKLPKAPRNPLVEFGIDLRKAMIMNDLGPGDLMRRMNAASTKFDELGRAMSPATLGRLLSGSCTCMPKIVQMDLLLDALKLRPDDHQRLRARHRILSEALVIAKSLNNGLARVA